MVNNLTIIIPIYKLCSRRISNLKFVYGKIKTQLSNVDVKIVEQVDNINTPPYLANHYGRDHVKYVLDTKTFNKSWLINQSIEYIDTPYICVHDVDVYYNFKNSIKPELYEVDFYQPFYACKHLNMVQTNELISKSKIPDQFITEKNGTDDRYTRMYGALSYIFNKKSFYEIGKLNESYTGWGFEDCDLFLRVPNNRLTINKTITGVHLWHPTNHVNKEKNREIFTKIGLDITNIEKKLNTIYPCDWKNNISY